MNPYFLATFIFLLLMVIWAGALIFLWATRPVASPMLFLRAFACVGAVIVCALAGLSTLNEANADTPMWRVVWGIAGLTAAGVAAHQTQALLKSRDYDLRGPATSKRRGRKR